MRSDLERLFDVLEAIKKIEQHYTQKIIETDELAQYGLLHLLQIIGEATNQLSKELKEKYPQVSWREIIGLRNFVVHQYFQVDWEIISNIIQKELPVLKLQIQSIIDAREENKSKMKNKLNLPSKIHFIGIGGAGMNPLAGICLKEGIKVTGSDSTQNKNQDELRALGADIWTPHSAEELAERELPDICVYSTAISVTPPVKGAGGFESNNPEVIYLKEKGVKFWHRSDLLERIANNFEKQIVIAGTHGKTTTTAMLVWILEKAGLKPCWVLGGVLKGLGSYGWSDQREIFVFEGDESDQSFLKSKPYIGVVTSLEPDHLENYNNSFEEQIKKFGEFADKCENFICHENIQKYFSVNNLQTYKYSSLLKNKLKISGEHNYLNALGALSVINNLNIKNPKTFFEKAILDIRKKALSEPNCKDFLDYDLVSDKQAEILTNILFENTGEKINFKNYKRCLTCDEIRKIERKHGLNNEVFEDQEPISEKDYLLLPEILENPDCTLYSGKSLRHKLPTFKYSKQINGHIYIIEEIRKSRNKLALLSMYKKKNPRNKSEVTTTRLDALPESSLQANDLNDNSLDFNNNYTSQNINGNIKTFFEEAINYLKDFPGIYRRFEIIGTTKNNITVIDDYAHHPTEVKAAIQAGKEFLKYPPSPLTVGEKGKLIVCFQPHLPTRLRDLWKEFTECFAEADQLFLLDLYVARGKPIEGVNSENLFKEIKHNNKVHIFGKAENLIEPVCKVAEPNDLILILGAGDITFIREKLFENLS